MKTKKIHIPYEIKLYSHLTVIAGVLFLAGIFFTPSLNPLQWNSIVLLSILTFIFLLRPFIILSNEIAYYLDDIPIYAAIFLLGTKSTLLVILLGFTFFEIYKIALNYFKKKPASLKLLYLSYSNTGQILISCGIASMVFTFINKGHPVDASFITVSAAAACALVKFILNAAGSTFSAYLSNRTQTLGQIWKKNFDGIWVHILMLAPLGLIFSYFISVKSYLAIFLIIPVAILYYACASFKKTLTHINKVFQTLVRSIDKRDHYTFGHSRRVAAYSKALAQELGLSHDDIIMSERAGHIHDLGKIGISDEILQKSARLNDYESAIMQTHPSIALSIFRNLHTLKKYMPAEISAMHHERYDGKGYVLGLKDHEIPVIARILAVADTFDAMTSERIYRRKIPAADAVKRLKELKGTQLDPEMVDSFTRLYAKGVIDEIKTRWAFSESLYEKILFSEELEKRYLKLKQIFN
ncbi:MAG: HD domain-containing phosphohydrolase [Armatimonadota bacterium]